MYRIQQTKEAKQDVRNLAAYIRYSLKNGMAAINFLKTYDKQVHNLLIFPYGYRGIGLIYQGYEIRIKTFSSYNIFFVIDTETQQITILRVLKDRQNWKAILQKENKYSF